MESKTINSSLNFVFSLATHLVTIILAFAVRTVFVKTLGPEYLGLNGLFTNIISILSLAELGVGTAIVYSMYKPIKDGDKDKICQLVNYYKKIYAIIAVVVLILGISFFPFLGFFINLEHDIPNVEFYYFLFLGQTVSSYLLVYRTSVLTAYQKDYISSRTSIITTIASHILQIAVLVLWKNYVAYAIVAIVFSLLTNAINSIIATKRYPFIVDKKTLPKEEKTSIWKNIKSMFLYKFGGVVLNNTDNLLISRLVSTIALGLYSNYCLIIDKVSGVVNLIFSSIQASLGDYNVRSSPDEKYKMFKTISFVQFWVYSFCCVSFCVLFDDFIKIWIGNEYQLDMLIVYICVFNFYLRGVLYPLWCFRNTTGIFKDTKYVMLFASALNLGLSIILGIYFGLAGILISTALARIFTSIWFEPLVLFKKYFNKSVLGYYLTELLRFIVLAVVIIASQYLFFVIPIGNIYLRFIFKIIFCLIVPNATLLLLFYRTREFKFVLSKVKYLIKKKN